MKLSTIPFLFLLPLVTAHADTLYKCTEESGQVLYTNQKSPGKKCAVLSRELPVATFKAPKAARASTPGDFPRVSGDQQRARDNDRRAILDQELASEQKQLEESKKTLAEQEAANLPEDRMGGKQGRLQNLRDTVALHGRNIEALKKEISNLR